MQSRAPAWPLSGVRVVDLSREISGPYATKLLADAGADVIKLEPPAGDPLRRFTASRTPLPDGEDGALFRFLNASKRSAVVDLDAQSGRDLLRELVASADLLLDDQPPGALDARGLGPEALREIRPRLCQVSISPFGQTGPWAGRAANDWTLQAAIGITARRGLPERGPVGIGGRVGEWVAGAWAATGALAAWRAASRSGRGVHLDLSAFEAMLLVMTQYHDLNGQFHGGELVQYVDNPSIEPARDGWVGFATVTSQQWQDFCLMIGHPELAQDERFQSADQRMRELARFQDPVRAWTRERTVDEIVEIASALRIPVAPIGNGETLPRTDHFRERGVFVRNPAGFLQPRTPWRLERTPMRPPGHAPSLGQHTDEILAEAARARAAAAPPVPRPRPPTAPPSPSRACAWSTSPRSGRGPSRPGSSARSARTW